MSHNQLIREAISKGLELYGDYSDYMCQCVSRAVIDDALSAGHGEAYDDAIEELLNGFAYLNSHLTRELDWSVDTDSPEYLVVAKAFWGSLVKTMQTAPDKDLEWHRLEATEAAALVWEEIK